MVLMIIPGLYGQPPKSAGQRKKKKKITFFNRELDLSKAEAKAFWPLYNDYQNRRNKIVAEKRNLMRYYNTNSRNITDEEITRILENYIRLERDETELLETFNTRFREILPDEKVLRIYIAEVRFKDHLLKRLRTD